MFNAIGLHIVALRDGIGSAICVADRLHWPLRLPTVCLGRLSARIDECLYELSRFRIRHVDVFRMPLHADDEASILHAQGFHQSVLRVRHRDGLRCELLHRLVVIAVGYDMLSVELRKKATGGDVRLMVLSGSKSPYSLLS